jgi:hypothetical protein
MSIYSSPTRPGHLHLSLIGNSECPVLIQLQLREKNGGSSQKEGSMKDFIIFLLEGIKPVRNRNKIVPKTFGTNCR